jgi:hypothetical protein
MKSDAPRTISNFEQDMRCRTFWVAISFNQFLSCEYGRTRVTIDSIGCRPLEVVGVDFTACVVNLMQLVPSRQVLACSVEVLLGKLKLATEFEVKSHFIGLLKADVCSCLFRMLRSMNTNLPATLTTALLDTIQVALNGVKFLTAMEHPVSDRMLLSRYHQCMSSNSCNPWFLFAETRS